MGNHRRDYYDHTIILAGWGLILFHRHLLPDPAYLAAACGMLASAMLLFVGVARGGLSR